MKISFIIILYILFSALSVLAQPSLTVKGKVFDAVNKEPLQGVSVTDGHNHGSITDAAGRFSIITSGKYLIITSIGYKKKVVEIKGDNMPVALHPSYAALRQIVVSADRTPESRSEAPVAIATINKQVMEDTRAQRLDMLLNKVSGVNMINLGNEQHEMSIRQPMSTNNVFLYLEDGIPIRTSAVFNHNALLEMNMAAAKSIEVIKGPSSALYGAEAIGGVVNVITQAPPAYTSGTISAQINDQGYKRMDVQVGTTIGKVGFIASGYYANQTNGPIQYSDFHKSASTYRLDYKIDSNTAWTNSVTYVDYYSDMYGDLDSAHFARKNYASQVFFTYRKVFAFRGRSTVTHKWSRNSTTSATFVFRNNSVIQNPSYQIGSYHVGGISSNPVSADTATGNINDDAFKSYGLYLQQIQQFRFLQSRLIMGVNAELDPQSYYQQFIWVKKENINGLTDNVSFTKNDPDSITANYHTVVSNFGSYADYDFRIAKGLRISAALRYDAFQYAFVNSLLGSKVTGGPSAITNYGKLAPKLGFTYNHNGIGFYGTYSEGYVPPQITDVFSKMNSTYLLPQTFRNFEVGGWLSLLGDKLYADYSIYLMNGRDEIISVRLPDNTTVPENAGATRHEGIEYGVTYRPGSDWYFRISGSNARHTYVNYVSGGVSYNGKEMATAPHFFGNAEVIYKPHYIKGLRAGLEWQHVGKYYMDNLDQNTYDGYSVTNLRIGYDLRHFGVWLNALNVFNEYYSVLSTVSVSNGAATYDYRLGDPRAFTIGISYKFGK